MIDLPYRGLADAIFSRTVLSLVAVACYSFLELINNINGLVNCHRRVVYILLMY